MNIQHLPCLAIILAVCAFVLCVVLAFWFDGFQHIFGAGGKASQRVVQTGQSCDNGKALKPMRRPADGGGKLLNITAQL